MGKIMHGGIEYSGGGGGGGGSSTFAGLSDVSLSNLADGQVPKYNATTQKWENANESSGGGVNYSLTEQVIGTWIDGKPLYQKTVECGTLLNNDMKYIPHNIANLKRIIEMNGYSFNATAGNITVPLPFVAISSLAGQMLLQADDTNIRIRTGQDRTGWLETYVTLRYTKTTD